NPSASEVQRLRREGDLGAVTPYYFADRDQHVLFDFMEFHPFAGLGEGVDHDVQRARGETVEVDDQRLAGVNFRVSAQQCLDVGNDGLDLGEVIVANAHSFFQPAMRHA